MSDPPRYSASDSDDYGISSVEPNEGRPLLSGGGEEDAEEQKGSDGKQQTQAVRPGTSIVESLGTNHAAGSFEQRYQAERPMIVYQFRPTYMVPGDDEQAFGVMGRNREDMLSIVRRAFPVLEDYPDQRIQLKVGPVASQQGGKLDPDLEAGGGEIAEGRDSVPSDGGAGLRYPPSTSSQTGPANDAVKPWSTILDEAWGYLNKHPPAAIQVSVAHTEAEVKAYMWRQNRAPIYALSGAFGTMLVLLLVAYINSD